MFVIYFFDIKLMLIYILIIIYYKMHKIYVQQRMSINEIKFFFLFILKLY